MRRGMFAVLVLVALFAVAQPAMAFHRHGCRGSHCGRFFAGRHGHGGCPYGGCGNRAAYSGAYASMYGQYASFYPNPPRVAYGSVRSGRGIAPVARGRVQRDESTVAGVRSVRGIAPVARVSGSRSPSYGFGYPMAYPGRPYFPSDWSGYGTYRYAAGSWYGAR